jgi:ArsR family transcriptional regulator
MGDVPLMTARLFKAVSHPVRVAILEALRDGPKCVCEFVPLLDVDQPAASKHIAILRSEGLIIGCKEGQRLICRLADETVLELLDLSYGFLRERWRKEGALWSEGGAESFAGRPVALARGRTDSELTDPDGRDQK